MVIKLYFRSNGIKFNLGMSSIDAVTLIFEYYKTIVVYYYLEVNMTKFMLLYKFDDLMKWHDLVIKSTVCQSNKPSTKWEMLEWFWKLIFSIKKLIKLFYNFIQLYFLLEKTVYLFKNKITFFHISFFNSVICKKNALILNFDFK